MKNAKKTFLASILKKGEVYAGIILGKEGDPDHHLILLPSDQAMAQIHPPPHLQ
jgi:hypothetical protein